MWKLDDGDEDEELLDDDALLTAEDKKAGPTVKPGGHILRMWGWSLGSYSGRLGAPYRMGAVWRGEPDRVIVSVLGMVHMNLWRCMARKGITKEWLCLFAARP